MKKIAPSFLAADIWRCAEQVAAIEAAGCEYLHLDIMDGHFVPNISYGPGFVGQLRQRSKMFFDTHLMVTEPSDFFADFTAAGADILSIHVETSFHLDRSLLQIHDLGLKAGIVLNPATPLDWMDHVMDRLDIVLLMSVNPGFGGQKFIPSTLPKLRAARARIQAHEAAGGQPIWLEVDGGVKADNIGDIVRAGADTCVAGSAVFGAPDADGGYRTVMQQLLDNGRIS